MDIPAFVSDGSTFSARAHLSEIDVRIPTNVSVLPRYLKGVGVFLEEFRLFREPVHNAGYGTRREKSTVTLLRTLLL